jgi:hypothetical protein
MNLARKPRASVAACAVAGFALLGAAAAHAQPAATPQHGSATTRAAQKAEIQKLEQNGYQPGTDDPHYPQNLQNAQKKARGGAAASAPAPAN